MSNKVVLFSDFHAHIFQDYAKSDPKYVTDRFKDQLDTLSKVFEIAREEKAQLLFGGDLFHKRSKLEDVVFNNVFRIVAENSDVKTHLLRGNHDSKNNTTDSEHWLETFKYLPHVTVMDVPTKVTADMFDIYAIPYSDDVAYLKQCIESFAEEARESSKHSILLGHIGVDGSQVGKYNHRLEGAFSLGDLHPDDFSFVALGHYHKRQFLGGRDDVFYIGNTIQTSFSDEGQEKGVFIIDLGTNKVDFKEIPNKQFITLNKIDSNTQQLVDNNYVRFILDQEQAKEVEVFKESSDNVRIEVQKEYKTDTRIDISVDSEDTQIVEAYTKEFYPESTKEALEVLQEAKLRL